MNRFRWCQRANIGKNEVIHEEGNRCGRLIRRFNISPQYGWGSGQREITGKLRPLFGSCSDVSRDVRVGAVSALYA
ncbi:MAG: hypothetical protein N2376_02345, partial [Clostridia bacterium]|nr:hypothetical protein [Clostridia bacterium]